MLRKTTKILAVALTVSACGGSHDEIAEQVPAPPGAATSPNKQALAEELAKTSVDDALANDEHFAPLCDGDGYPLPGNVNNKQPPRTTVTQFCQARERVAPETKPAEPTTTPPVEPGTKPAPAPEPPPAACDRKALSEALGNKTLEQAVTEHKQFRCLCDDDGYPLVGNINAKGATASQFCAVVKDKDL